MSSAEVAPQVAIVLPPKEGFSPGAVGAIGLLVHRLVRAGAPGVVLGRAGIERPFADVPFMGVTDGWGLSGASRYAAGVRRAVRQLGAGLIEVHNWPEVALRLAGSGRVTLILNNDPRSMRAARTPAERQALLRRLSGIATSSAWLADRFMQGVDGKPLTTLPNCVEIGPPPNPARENLILFAGRVVRDKGADLFVEACAAALPALPGWRAEMIGGDRFRPDAPDTAFIRALRPKAAAAAVAMHGYQPNDAVIAAMRRAAITVVPSRWAEPFGIVALEAMAAGSALIASNRGGLPEVGGDAALYIDPESPGALATAITSLAQDPTRRAALAAAARARAMSFDAGAAAARLTAFRQGVML